MPKRSIRLTEAIDQRIQSAAKLRGYSNPSAFLRAAIKKELNEPGEGSAANEKILGSIREVRQDVRRVERAQQALFALVDSFAKVFVTCVPEPRGEAMQTALGRGAKTPRPAAHECGPRDAQRLDSGDGGLDEPWRKIETTSRSFGFGHRSRQRGVNAESTRPRIASSCITPG